MYRRSSGMKYKSIIIWTNIIIRYDNNQCLELSKRYLMPLHTHKYLNNCQLLKKPEQDEKSKRSTTLNYRLIATWQTTRYIVNICHQQFINSLPNSLNTRSVASGIPKMTDRKKFIDSEWQIWNQHYAAPLRLFMQNVAVKYVA